MTGLDHIAEVIVDRDPEGQAKHHAEDAQNDSPGLPQGGADQQEQTRNQPAAHRGRGPQQQLEPNKFHRAGVNFHWLHFFRSFFHDWKRFFAFCGSSVCKTPQIEKWFTKSQKNFIFLKNFFQLGFHFFQEKYPKYRFTFGNKSVTIHNVLWSSAACINHLRNSI